MEDVSSIQNCIKNAIIEIVTKHNKTRELNEAIKKLEEANMWVSYHEANVNIKNK